MLLHRIHISTDDWPAESSRRAKNGVVFQRLLQDRNHALLRRFPIYSRKRSNLLGGREQGGEKRRRKRSPKRGMQLCPSCESNSRVHPSPEPRAAQRIALAKSPSSCERNSHQCRPGAPHKRHQGMRRCHHCSTLAQNLSSSLVSAPLECTATFLPGISSDQRAIVPRGRWKNPEHRSKSARPDTSDRAAHCRDAQCPRPNFFANVRDLRIDSPRERPPRPRLHIPPVQC